MATSAQYSFVIVRYEGRSGAAKALSRLRELEGEGVVEIADAVVVYRNRRGKIKLHQTRESSPRRASALGGAAGLVIGAALGGPVVLAALGGAAGGAAGGAVARLRDSGVGTAIKRALGLTFVPQSACVMSSTRRTDTPARYISIKASSTELSRRR